jgi:hypothetical protein
MRSTNTLSVDLQSMMSRALDSGEYVLVSSLDLSSAFDVVNIKLLIESLRIIRLPNDLIELIKVWLEGRSFYVSIDGLNSYILDLMLGTVQSSVLGPVLTQSLCHLCLTLYQYSLLLQLESECGQENIN